MHFLLVLVTLLQVTGSAPELSDPQIKEAIELGRLGTVPVVQVGTSTGDFNVYIEGPVARIAFAAATAFRRYKPFDLSNVTPEMKAPLFRVFYERSDRPRSTVVPRVERIVLQAKGAKGMDGVVQPVKEPGTFMRMVREANFDRLPDGEFDVVLVTSGDPQKYLVTEKQRVKIR